MATFHNKFLNNLKTKFDQSKAIVRQYPFRSLNVALGLLREIQMDITSELKKHDATDEKHKTCSYILGSIYYEIGQLFLKSNDLDTAKTHLEKCLKSLDPWKQQSECVIACMGSLVLLDDIHLRPSREQFDKAQLLSEQAEDLHFQFKRSELVPITIYELFGTKDKKNDMYF